MKGKKSFILYCDLITTVEKLPDDVAGRLFKTILEYVNDQNPVVEDLLLQVAFEPVKQQLKRDLIDWHQERQDRSESGRIGGLKSGEARRSTASKNEAPLQKTKQTEANEAVTVNVTVTENVNVNETHKQPVFENLKIFFGFESEHRYVTKWSEIIHFLNRRKEEGKAEYFINQFEFYKQYKAESKEKIHSWPSFVNGGWDQENWEHKLKEFKKIQVANGKTPATPTTYIAPAKKQGLSEERIAEVLRQDKERLEKLAKEYKPGPPQPPSDNSLGSRMRKQFDKLAPKP